MWLHVVLNNDYVFVQINFERERENHYVSRLISRKMAIRCSNFNGKFWITSAIMYFTLKKIIASHFYRFSISIFTEITGSLPVVENTKLRKTLKLNHNNTNWIQHTKSRAWLHFFLYCISSGLTRKSPSIFYKSKFCELLNFEKLLWC